MTDGPSPPDAGFAVLDWAILGVYAAVLAVSGWWFSRRGAGDSGDYFLAGRRMPAWAVAVSVLATSLSAATFLGVPQLGYEGDLTYLATNIGMIAAAVVVATVLLPPMYRMGVATPYGLLEQRYGQGARRVAAGAFLIGQVFASGSRLYMVAIPAALIIFGEPAGDTVPFAQLAAAIGIMALVGVVYTLAGGVRSVIWTDVVQTGVFLLAIIGAIVIALGRIPGGAGTALETLSTATTAEGTPKLTLFDLSTGLDRSFSLLACCTGFMLLGIASYGTDQNLVQRMLTCRSSPRAAWSVIGSNLVAVPVISLFMIVGLLLHVFYHGPGSESRTPPADSTRVFLSFILSELPAGLPGLMLAGLFAAGLSSVNSSLNAMGSTVLNDFYRQFVPDRDERHYLLVGRLGVISFGIILGGVALICVGWQRSSGQTLIGFALGVMTFAYAGLLGVFGSLVLTRRGNGPSAIAAIVAGFAAVLAQQPFAWGWLIERLADDSTLRRVLTEATETAFPWKLLFASAISFGVCQLGSTGRLAVGLSAMTGVQPTHEGETRTNQAG